MIVMLMLLALPQRPPIVVPQDARPSAEPEAAQEAEPTPAPATPAPVEPEPEVAQPPLAPLASQDPVVYGPQPWSPLNRVDLLINDECITSNDIQRAIVREGRPVTNEAERRQRSEEIMERLIKGQLKVQAGRDLKFDQDMVQRFVDDHVRDTKLKAGSAGKLADQLADTDLDAVSYHENIESMVLQDLWTGAVIGKYPGVGGRIFRDRDIRPSRLKFEFERQEGDLDLPSTVTLQEMAFNPKYTGSLEAARETAERVLEEVRAGGDFTELAIQNEAASPTTKGLYEPFDESKISQIPDIGEFLAGAVPGDVSEVMPVREDGVLRAFRVLKLVDRTEAQVARFEDAEVQDQLRKRYLQLLDGGREEEALGQLLDSAYVWPPEVFGRVRPPEPAPTRVDEADEPVEAQEASR